MTLASDVIHHRRDQCLFDHAPCKKNSRSVPAGLVVEADKVKQTTFKFSENGHPMLFFILSQKFEIKGSVFNVYLFFKTINFFLFLN